MDFRDKHRFPVFYAPSSVYSLSGDLCGLPHTPGLSNLCHLEGREALTASSLFKN